MFNTVVTDNELRTKLYCKNKLDDILGMQLNRDWIELTVAYQKNGEPYKPQYIYASNEITDQNHIEYFKYVVIPTSDITMIEDVQHAKG